MHVSSLLEDDWTALPVGWTEVLSVAGSSGNFQLMLGHVEVLPSSRFQVFSGGYWREARVEVSADRAISIEVASPGQGRPQRLKPSQAGINFARWRR